ncbi:MAG: ATP-binding protein [Deltaproteobacteria bacterium]|nr:ATP-binding protein [Deltaproteobacteria bacterium]
MSAQSTSVNGSNGPASEAVQKIKEDSHREALATLLYSIEQSEGWALVVGRAGSGKTQLVAELEAALSPEVTCVHLSAEQCPTPIELFRRMHEVLQMAGPCQYKARFLLDLREVIQEYRRQGRKILVVIDGAQNWGPEMLREIELLGNEDQFSPRVLNIFLLARPEFLRTLEAMGATNLKHNLRRFRRLASPSDALPPVGERRRGPRSKEGIDYFDNRPAQEMHRLAGAKLEALGERIKAQEEAPKPAPAKHEPAGGPVGLEQAAKVGWPDSQEKIDALLDLVFGPAPPRA